MAMYALPGWTTWDANSGAGNWSSTSGGASNGSYPQGTDDVVFDANSGPSRTITISGTPQIKSLTTVGANAMTFGTTQLSVFGSVNLTGTTSFAYLFCGSASTDYSVTFGNCTIGTLYIDCGSWTASLGSNVTLTTQLTVNAGTFNGNTYNITTPQIILQGGTLNMSSSLWTVTGSGNNTFSNNGGCTIVPGTSTLKFTYSGSSDIEFYSSAKTYGNLWVARSGSGSFKFNLLATNNGNTFANIKISAGSNVILPANATTTASSFTIDGTGAVINLISGSTGTAATLAKSGGGTVYVDYCSIKDITASPSSTFYARNSTNVSGNTNWTFIPGNSKFMTFF